MAQQESDRHFPAKELGGSTSINATCGIDENSGDSIAMRQAIKLFGPATLATVLVSSPAYASAGGSDWVTGVVKDVTSTREGVLVKMDDGRVPTNCANVSTWLMVAQQNTAMISVFLTYWAAGKKTFTIYTDATASGYCQVSLIDPAD